MILCAKEYFIEYIIRKQNLNAHFFIFNNYFINKSKFINKYTNEY